MNLKQFLKHFEAQNFSQALNAFNELGQDEQESVLKQLYYHSREAKTPIAVSVLYRKLHEGKMFDDFYNAWMPPQEAMQPFIVDEKIYHHFFNVPTRVINAVNREDPKEIVSIGLVWCDTEEQFQEGLKQATQDKNNTIRGDSVATVAEKISAKIYKVASDTQLGN